MFVRILFLGLLLVPLGSRAAEARRAPVPDGVSKLAAGNAEFAFELLRGLPGEGNVFLSPHSLSEAMAMAYAGARGETAAAMGRGMRYGLPQEAVPGAFAELRDLLGRPPERSHGDGQPLSLEVTNAFWADRSTPFRREYVHLLRTTFAADARTADFRSDAEGARREINAWVAENTREKVLDLLSPGAVGADTSLVLVNAVFFKGAWRRPFDVADTRPGPFTKADGTRIEIPTMRGKAPARWGVGEGYMLAELPYARSDAVMTILLPDEGRLEALQARLTPEVLGAMLASSRVRNVRLSLPRIHVRTKLEASDVLKEMGLSVAFAGGADFSGMSESGRLFIARVVHEAVLDVDEAGTEAAAATAVVLDKGAEPRPVSFTVDRPFLVLIRNTRTNAILFLGRVSDPTGAS